MTRKELLENRGEPDSQTGHYYATVRDDSNPVRTSFLIGPFTQRVEGTRAHEEALAAVETAKAYVTKTHARSAWWSFGTARLPLDASAPEPKLQVCRDCGEAFQYDKDADRCDDCVAAEAVAR